jgi:hypothetical protein
MHTSATSSTGHALQMTGVRARPDETDDQVRSAKNQRDDDQFAYRHLERQQPSHRAEHVAMLIVILAMTSTFF